MSRILGLDYGHKRIGLALSDEDGKIAFEYEIWQFKDFFARIKALIEEKEIEKVVLGYPLGLKASETEKTKEAAAFKKKLEKEIDIPVEFIDERFSSKFATSLTGRNKNIDALAAQIFLQNYLDKNN